MRYNETDELANEISFAGIECDSEVAEKITINEIIREKRKTDERGKENKVRVISR